MSQVNDGAAGQTGDDELPGNRSMPTQTVISVLTYADVASAVVWLSAAFGLTVRLRMGEHRG